MIKEYKYGVQFASFYMPGHFVPQVRMMKTGNENIDLARKFGLPYIVLHNPRPFDTTTLNYNWQIWDTEAFSIYTSSTEKINKESAGQGVDSVLNFMAKEGILDYESSGFVASKIVESENFVTIRSNSAGFLDSIAKAGDKVIKGQVIAYISDPYTSDVLQTVKSDYDGIIVFAYDSPLAYMNTALFKIIPEKSQ